MQIEHDQLSGIHGRLRAVRDHERHRLTHEPDAAFGEWRSGEDRRHHLEANAGRKAQITGREHGHDALRRHRRGDIHRANLRVGQSRPNEGRLQTSVWLDVVDITTSASYEARVLAPADGVTQD
jgi:hypothetical protein